MVSVWNRWSDGCVKGELMEESLKKESGWVHMMEICLDGNWVCAGING